jgi:uncharacterized protein with HEPN domain
MPPKDEARLRHMLEAAEKIRQITKNKSRAELNKNEILTLALTRLLEILGEAANQVSDGAKEANPQLPWREMIGVRNHLIHGYFDVDLDIVWQIINKDLPPLIKALNKILS